MWTISDIKKIKEYYSKEKYNFAKRVYPSYYSNAGDEYGKTYGYTLEEPFASSYLDEYQINNNITFEVNFYIYLTQISSEIFTGSYPVIIGLPDNLGVSIIPENENSIFSYCDLIEEEEIDFDSSLGMVQVIEDGCSFGSNYIINGLHLYEIWSYDGDYNYKQYNNFTEMIEDNMNKWK